MRSHQRLLSVVRHAAQREEGNTRHHEPARYIRFYRPSASRCTRSSCSPQQPPTAPPPPPPPALPVPTRHRLATGARGRCGHAGAAPTCVPGATCSYSLYFLLIFARLFWCYMIPYRVIRDRGLPWKNCGVAARRNDSSVPRHRRHNFLSRNQSRRAHFAPPRPFSPAARMPRARQARPQALRPRSRRPDVRSPPIIPVCIFC